MKTKQTKTFEKKLNEVKKKRKINPKLTVISPSAITYQFTNKKELKNCLKQIKKVEPEIYISFNKEEFEALFAIMQDIHNAGYLIYFNPIVNVEYIKFPKKRDELKSIYKKLDALLPQKKEKK